MIAAPEPGEVLTKKDFGGVVVVVMRNVEAKPLPPWEAIVVVEASRERACRMAGSTRGDILSFDLLVTRICHMMIRIAVAFSC